MRLEVVGILMCAGMSVLPFTPYTRTFRSAFEKVSKRPTGKRLLIYFVVAFEAAIFGTTLQIVSYIFWPSSTDAPLLLKGLITVLLLGGVAGMGWTEYKRKQLQKLG